MCTKPGKTLACALLARALGGCAAAAPTGARHRVAIVAKSTRTEFWEGAQRPSRRILYRTESRKEHGKRNGKCRISEGKNIFIASLILHFTLYILHFQGLVRLRGSCPARRSAQGDRWRRLRRAFKIG